MPYLLTAGNHPGSPASWIQTEDGNTSNAGITLPDNLMTSVTSHGGNTSSHFVENLGTNKVNILDSRCVKIIQNYHHYAEKYLIRYHFYLDVTYKFWQYDHW